MATSPTKARKSPAAKTKANTVCPFCALLCDDVTLKIDADTVSPLNLACPNAKRQYARLGLTPDAPALLDPATGKRNTVSLKEAIAATAAHLKSASKPYFGGLGTDLDALRVIHELGGHCGAVLEHLGSDSTLANVGVMQTLGWYTTTLSEIRNRSDLVLIVGADCKNRYGRFVERILEPAAALASAARKNRRVVYLGPRKNAPRSKKFRIENIYCEPQEIAPLLSVLRAQVLGKKLASEVPQSPKLSTLGELLTQAAYASVVWSSSDFSASQARLCIESISKMLADLNTTTRAAGLSLGGDDGGMSAMQVSAWRSGYPLRVSYAGGEPSYDPQNNRLERLVENKQLDCFVWVDAFGRADSPPRIPDVPYLFIGHPEKAKRVDADVVIPVGLPGIHHKARLVRTDSVVTMPLDRVRASKLPSVKSVFDSLIAQLNSEAN